MHFLDRSVNIMVKCSEQIVYCKTAYVADVHATCILVYIRTDFEFDMQLPVCMCSVSLHYNVSILQEFCAMHRVVSLARLLHNLGVEKRFNSGFNRVLYGILINWHHVCLLTSACRGSGLSITRCGNLLHTHSFMSTYAWPTLK